MIQDPHGETSTCCRAIYALQVLKIDTRKPELINLKIAGKEVSKDPPTNGDGGFGVFSTKFKVLA